MTRSSGHLAPMALHGGRRGEPVVLDATGCYDPPEF